MIINKCYLDENLPNIIKNFEVQNFNKLSIENKKELINELSKLVCNTLNTKIDINNISFINKTELNSAGALFRFYKNDILLNIDFLNKKLNELAIACLVDNVIHETIHYCQKQNDLYIEDLKLTLPFPYNILQNHETNAYAFTTEILKNCKLYLSTELNNSIDSVIELIGQIHDNCINDLAKRNYSTNQEDILKQIEEVRPFSKNISKIQELKDSEKLLQKTIKNSQSIEMSYLNNNEIAGIISINEPNGINRLQFTILNNTCFINDISKLHAIYGPISVSKLNKRNLIDILNKIIEVGNKEKRLDCYKLVINPISFTDNKKEYDNFISDIINEKVKANIFNNNITVNQIKQDIFNNNER